MEKTKIREAKSILKSIGMPTKQQSDICALTLLAMAQIFPDETWETATNDWIRIHDVIVFSGENYNRVYAENSRETFRKQAMHPFRTAAFIEDNGKATNSPLYRYRLTSEALFLLKQYKKHTWKSALDVYLTGHETLMEIYASKKTMTKMPVKINSANYQFSAGDHNKLQKAIIEEFAPRFAPDSECLYVGDTTEKDLVKNVGKLSALGFEITVHDKMPDVVLYREDTDWIFFIEAVTSVGPMDPKRIIEIDEMTQNVRSEKIFITAFLNFKTYKKFASELAWETEVWIAELPDHMIHLNGDKFLGPR